MKNTTILPALLTFNMNTVPDGFGTGPVVAADVVGTPTGVGTVGWLFNVEAVATIMAPNPSNVATHQISNPSTGAEPSIRYPAVTCSHPPSSVSICAPHRT